MPGTWVLSNGTEFPALLFLIRCPGASQVVLEVKHLPASSGDARDVASILGLGRCLGVGNGTPVQWHPTPVFLPGKSHGQRKLAGSNPWGCKELEMTEHTHCVLNHADCWDLFLRAWGRADGGARNQKSHRKDDITNLNAIQGHGFSSAECTGCVS